MNLPVITSFVFYLVCMLAIGIFFYLRTKDLNDYVLGGRQLGGAVAALSAGASDMSGWLLLGLPGRAVRGRHEQCLDRRGAGYRRIPELAVHRQTAAYLYRGGQRLDYPARLPGAPVSRTAAGCCGWLRPWLSWYFSPSIHPPAWWEAPFFSNRPSGSTIMWPCGWEPWSSFPYTFPGRFHGGKLDRFLPGHHDVHRPFVRADHRCGQNRRLGKGGSPG